MKLIPNNGKLKKKSESFFPQTGYNQVGIESVGTLRGE